MLIILFSISKTQSYVFLFSIYQFLGNNLKEQFNEWINEWMNIKQKVKIKDKKSI